MIHIIDVEILLTIEKSNKKYSKKTQPKDLVLVNLMLAKSTYPKWQVFGQVEHGDKLGYFSVNFFG
jgi:hypothetical protein